MHGNTKNMEIEDMKEMSRIMARGLKLWSYQNSAVTEAIHKQK